MLEVLRASCCRRRIGCNEAAINCNKAIPFPCDKAIPLPALQAARDLIALPAKSPGESPRCTPTAR
jgi:hypothetical protein